MTTLEDLVAYHELSAIKARYCRTLDNKDWQGLAALLTPNVQFGLCDGASEPNVIVGRNEMLSTLRALVDGATTVHQVHCPEIDLGDTGASVIWAVQDRAVYDNGISVTGYGHYYERWVRRGGSWQLASMMLSHLITDTD
ncbi:nuclear transport factor 2 family protein [Mycobacterium sp. 236(2023)]|uniref:nuclear transport factor 2 family protein n=1 Tax=Mycobacterium sp. 236(2023) TaxID=3038163 RepID=UPI0024159675|nr:nuclear transport factor 2 family protein [Mycobacterium sp. 236(2023)]MDG4669260.1 nuclear transport factor 2 family protein [Mycobacterium sp. 236(2023)]